MTDTLDTDSLDSRSIDSGCVDDSSDPVGSDDTSGDDTCSDESWSDDDGCSEADADGCDDGTDADSDERDDGADACDTDSDGCATDPPCWDDTLSAVPSEAVEQTAETAEVSDVAPSNGPAPLVALPAAALASLPTVAPVSPFAGVPGLGGDTEAILGSVSRQMADAGTLAHAPLGVPDPAVDAALARADVAGRASGSMAAITAQQEIVNSVREHEQRQSASEEAIRTQGFAERVESGLDGTFGSLGPF